MHSAAEPGAELFTSKHLQALILSDIHRDRDIAVLYSVREIAVHVSVRSGKSERQERLAQDKAEIVGRDAWRREKERRGSERIITLEAFWENCSALLEVNRKINRVT
jgi:hypothetical protein